MYLAFCGLLAVQCSLLTVNRLAVDVAGARDRVVACQRDRRAQR